jgi:hypothetical protein
LLVLKNGRVDWWKKNRNCEVLPPFQNRMSIIFGQSYLKIKLTKYIQKIPTSILLNVYNIKMYFMMVITKLIGDRRYWYFHLFSWSNVEKFGFDKKEENPLLVLKILGKFTFCPKSYF